jgi:hypothetical protein
VGTGRDKNPKAPEGRKNINVGIGRASMFFRPSGASIFAAS